jgi:hypothetical protein
LPKDRKDLSIKATVFGIHGNLLSKDEEIMDALANSVSDVLRLALPGTGGPLFFVRLTLSNINTNSLLDENLYWISTVKGDYKQLNEMQEANVSVIVNRATSTKAVAEIRNTGTETSFFMKAMVTDQKTGQQILPVYMDDNYLTLFPGERKFIEIDLYNLNPEAGSKTLSFELNGWNLKKLVVNIPAGN